MADNYTVIDGSGSTLTKAARDVGSGVEADKVVPYCGTDGGATPGHYISAGAANQDQTTIKASAGTLYSFVITCTAASARYVKFYDVASPTSASTPKLTVGAPATSTIAVSLGAVGAQFANVIAFRLTTGVADNDANSCSANDVALSYTYA